MPAVQLERVDVGLAHCTINAAGSHRVPIPPSIFPSVLIHGAMDNFDHEENTSSGIAGGSHDTILMLFQKLVRNHMVFPLIKGYLSI